MLKYIAAACLVAGSSAVADDASALITKGKALFATSCSACHGQKGEGVPGLGQNLTDLFMVNGSTKADIQKVISDGSPKNPMMIAWKNSMKPEQIKAITEYVWSIAGTNVKGRTAEGKAFKK